MTVNGISFAVSCGRLNAEWDSGVFGSGPYANTVVGNSFVRAFAQFGSLSHWSATFTEERMGTTVLAGDYTELERQRRAGESTGQVGRQVTNGNRPQMDWIIGLPTVPATRFNLHEASGNIAFADGSAQRLTTSGLRESFETSAAARGVPNGTLARLVFPD